MNKTFKLVYNRARGKMMAVNELTKSIGKAAAAGLILTTAESAAAALETALPPSGIVESDLLLETAPLPDSTQVAAALHLKDNEKGAITLKNGAELLIRHDPDVSRSTLFGIYLLDQASLDVKGKTDITLEASHVTGSVGMEIASTGPVATDDLSITLKNDTIADGLCFVPIGKNASAEDADAPLLVRGTLDIDLTAKIAHGIVTLPDNTLEDGPITAFPDYREVRFEGDTSITLNAQREAIGVENFANMHFGRDLTVDVTFTRPTTNENQIESLSESRVSARNIGLATLGHLAVDGDLNVKIQAGDNQTYNKMVFGLMMAGGDLTVGGETDIHATLNGAEVIGLASSTLRLFPMSQMTFEEKAVISATGNKAVGMQLFYQPAPAPDDDDDDDDDVDYEADVAGESTDHAHRRAVFNNDLTLEATGETKAEALTLSGWTLDVAGELQLTSKATDVSVGLLMESAPTPEGKTSLHVGRTMTIESEGFDAKGMVLRDAPMTLTVDGFSQITANAEEDGIGIFLGQDELDTEPLDTRHELTFKKGAHVTASGQYASGIVLLDPSLLTGDLHVDVTAKQSPIAFEIGTNDSVPSADTPFATFDGNVSATVTGEQRALGLKNYENTEFLGNLDLVVTKTTERLGIPEKPVAGIDARAALSIGGNLNILTVDNTVFGAEHYETSTRVLGLQTRDRLEVGGDTRIVVKGKTSNASGMTISSDDYWKEPDAPLKAHATMTGDLFIEAKSDNRAVGIHAEGGVIEIGGNTAILTTSPIPGEALALVALDSRVQLGGERNFLQGDVFADHSTLLFGRADGPYSHTVIDGTLFAYTATLTSLPGETETSAPASGLTVTNGRLEVLRSALLHSETTMTNANLVVGESAVIDSLTAQDATITLQKAESTLTLRAIDNPAAVTLAGGADFNDATGGDIGKLVENVTLEGGLEARDFGALRLEAGEILGEVTGTIDANGKVTQKVAANTKNQAKLNVTANVATMMTRVQMNELRKRMGDIRATDAAALNGVWARYNGGAMSGDFGLDTDFHMIQAGFDRALGAGLPRVGAAFSYARTESDDNFGSAESDAWTLAGYGVWTLENGLFADVIARAGMIDTDLTQSGETVGIDGFMWSVSGEFGTRANLANGFFVEPSAELTYTWIEGDDFTMRGVKRELDDAESLIGRVGAAVGMSLPKSLGDAYVRANIVHEFLGDSAITSSNGLRSARETWSGNDTWVEYAVGANININPTTYLYLDLERTEGAAIEEDWRANAGVRMSF